MQVGPRSGLIIGVKSTHPPTPPNLKFVHMTLNQGSGIQRPQGYEEDVWSVSGRCIEGVWKVSEKCMEGMKMVSRQYKNGV